MIIPDKTVTSNPFVDNVIYYSKLLAMNCTVKDEEEALSYETKESLRRRELLISSVEKTSTYEVYDSIPKEILEKYISLRTNLDIYAESDDAFRTRLNSFGIYERTEILDNISALARLVYSNHYEVMMNYLNDVGDSWFDDNKALYDSCKALTATYKDLFNQLPSKTVYRIIKTYINNYDNSNIEDISASLTNFQKYIDARSDEEINNELLKIDNAMRNVFISHYEIMVDRGYVRNDSTKWRKFIDEEDAYNHCINNNTSYYELYDLFPEDELLDSLVAVLGQDEVDRFGLLRGVDILDEYIEKYNPSRANELTENMRNKYLANYSLYMNREMYQLCLDGYVNYFDLSSYLPLETRKMVINSQIEETTNLDVYSKSKPMLNSFLSTLPKEERDVIKANITHDMQEWYPTHHVETNNYYRGMIGLPPLDDNGEQIVDTLIHSWDNDTQQFKEFGEKFFKRAPDSLYPEIHWKQELYEFDSYDIGILNQYGIIDDWVAACGADLNQPRYRYLKHLGDDALDIYTCSKAMNFQLIGMPTIDDSDFKRKFIDAYALNRDYVIRVVYSDAYKFQSDYYNKFMIIFILINTIMDCLANIPEYIIDREVFDSRCIKYLFESFGIPYYSEIPIKYQKAMLKNLNTLIKYKSSTRNMIDICSLFGFSDVRVFGYYLFKERCVDTNTGEYEFDEDNSIAYDLDKLYIRDKTGAIKDYNGVRYCKLTEYRYYDEEKYTKLVTYQDTDGSLKQKRIINNDMDVYLLDSVANDFIPLKDMDYFTKIKAEVQPADLKFIKVPVDDELSEYKNNPDYIIPYDEIVYQDEGDTWDGGEEHQHLRERLLDHEFNAVKTKYISVETVTEMTELAFQVAYFYNMLFDNMYSEDALTVEIPYIKIGHKFRFMDVVCYLFSLMYLYNGLEDNIMYSPTQILYVKGYNFNNDLNDVLKDAKHFQQTNPVTGEAYEDYQKYNIFDINERIDKDGYDYRKAFENYNIRAFNLECDVDELEKWMNDNFQMSLDDFIVDDTLTKFNQVITLRSFFSLNNSYYQKSIFKNNLLPSAFNQDIKYAFDYMLYKKTEMPDINENYHAYVTEDTYRMDIINDRSDVLYVMDYTSFIRVGPYRKDYAIYHKYIKQEDGSYVRENDIIYYKDQESDGEFKILFDGEIGIIDQNGNYIFAADKYYTKNEDGTFTEVTDNKYFSEDPNKRPATFNDPGDGIQVEKSAAVVPRNGLVKMHDQPEVEDKDDVLVDNHIWYGLDTGNDMAIIYRKILNFGEYYIYKDGKWILDPNNCYVKVERDGKIFYVLASEAGDYVNVTVEESDCFIRHSDGHFIRLTDTDYYKKKQNDEEYNGYVYTEEDCYVITSEETNFYDPEANPRVYYKKLSEYYSKNNYIVYRNEYFVKDHFGNYISQFDLIDPNNCYYDYNGSKLLVADALARVILYENQYNAKYLLMLQDNNDYYKYILNNKNEYVYHEDSVRRYVYNSDEEYVTVLVSNTNYDKTKSIIIVFNKYLDSYDTEKPSDKYNPEETDGIWDENDWYYQDGYSGEHLWYYKKPGQDPSGEKDELKDPVGSGFYFEASAYLGEVELEKGNKYYLAFDIETNFTGNIQIACDADDSVVDSQSNIYSVTTGESQHISQIFTANDNKRPGLRFLIYDYEENPINIGDFVTVSNIRFVKAYSDNYIAQDIPSYDKLQELYRTNEAIYNYLVNLMVNTDSIHMYNIYKKLYDSLMISKYNKEAFKIGENKYAKTYTDFLETRDAVLYERLCYFKSLDPDAMHKQVADNIVEVTYAIDDCVDTYSYGYLYSYFPAVSASYIQQYIIKIINFFKSWKVHLLGINTVYKFDDKLENTVRALECRMYRNRYDNIKSNVFIYGSVKINPMDDVNVSGEKYTDLYPDLVQFSHQYFDNVIIKDRIRIMATTADKFEHFYDSDGNLRLILNDETTKASTENDRLKITSSNAGFRVIDKNEVIMSTNTTGQEVYPIQKIDDINTDSVDIIDYKEDSED